ncbi:pentapeptide repeat-containing protein [Sphingomonas sp. OTU376]|uniref:pentapeptide repeat-containing protein n=1 Tax=Sphingomonas sp. OTU376 TaxID=3043863 RepID=UPI00313AFD96
MSAFEDGISRVMRILSSKSKSLRELAALSEREVFDFYRGANLVGLDLSQQDLRGMNFDDADIRFSSMNGTIFDEGAFNRSLLDESQNWLKDEFVYSLSDIENHSSDSILLFIKFRPGFVDSCIDILGMRFKEFSARSNVGESTLRKARKGDIISFETARNILSFLKDTLPLFDPDQQKLVSNKLRQPMALFFSGGINTAFKPVSPEKLSRLFQMREEIAASIPNTNYLSWRDTAEAIEWNYTYWVERDL